MPSETLCASWTKFSQSLPKGWKLSTLGEECEIIGGGTPKRNNPDYFSGDIPWATPTDVTALDGLYIATTKETVTPKGIASSSTKLLPKGTVLLTSRATIGFAAIAVVPICTNQGFANFICKNNLIPEYLAYWLPTQKELMFREAGGTTFKEISKGALKKFEIPVPPIEEQHRIVDILKRADGIRRLRKQAQDTARQLIPALFIDMFGDPATNPKGWPILAFGDVSDCRLGKMLDKNRQTGKHLRPYLRNANVQWGRFELSDMLEMDFDEKDRNIFSLRKGDVLICEGGEVGRAAIWDDDLAECYFQKALHRTRPNYEVVTSEYILWLMWALAKSGGLVDSTTQATIAHLTGVKLKSLRIPIPPIEKQKRFVAQVEGIHSILSQQQTAKESAELSFQSLLHRAFNG